jgi:integrase
MLTSTWTVDPVKILTRRVLATVLHDLSDRSPRSASQRMNRVIFRLACCSGLRVSEIAALRLADEYVGAARPHLWVGPERAKRKKAHVVPL